MWAMECAGAGQPLVRVERPMPVPARGEVLLEVLACGVCRTDLHVVDGDIAAEYPIVPGHQVVGRLLAHGAEVEGLAVGDRLGVAWLGRSCGQCSYCWRGLENLCDDPVFTGCTRDGGFASHMIADAAFCFALSDPGDPSAIAPLLCAGMIGYRALSLAGEAPVLGFYGFGSAAHILTQLALGQGRKVHALVRPGDRQAMDFALRLGCASAGPSDELPPEPLDAAILFAPDGALVPAALKAVRKGGKVVCAGIHMSDIPSFPYADLWEERSILSVANLTRADARALFAALKSTPVSTEVTCFPLAQANEALEALRMGAFNGSAVLVP